MSEAVVTAERTNQSITWAGWCRGVFPTRIEEAFPTRIEEAFPSKNLLGGQVSV